MCEAAYGQNLQLPAELLIELEGLFISKTPPVIPRSEICNTLSCSDYSDVSVYLQENNPLTFPCVYDGGFTIVCGDNYPNPPYVLEYVTILAWITMYAGEYRLGGQIEFYALGSGVSPVCLGGMHPVYAATNSLVVGFISDPLGSDPLDCLNFTRVPLQLYNSSTGETWPPNTDFGLCMCNLTSNGTFYLTSV